MVNVMRVEIVSVTQSDLNGHRYSEVESAGLTPAGTPERDSISTPIVDLALHKLDEFRVPELLGLFPDLTREGETQKIPSIQSQFLQREQPSRPCDQPDRLKVGDHQAKEFRLRY